MPGWKSVDEIIAYQLSVRLRDEILRLTRVGAVSKDWGFCDQIRDSARSAPRNLAEGFSRYNHGEFANFTNIAKASLAETLNHLRDGKTQSYFAPADCERLESLATEAIRTSTGLLRHLQSSKAPRPYWTDPSGNKQ